MEISRSSDASSNILGSVTSKIKTKSHIPWVEKYRPENVDDVSHQDEVIRALKSSIEQGSLPHLLFHGSPGTGAFPCNVSHLTKSNSSDNAQDDMLYFCVL